jgi:tRNA-2-methylthio-N6-dimethylallyladenosine synthase
MNRSDSERITAVLEKIGYKPALKENEADLILINMCSVRQSAVDRVYGLIPKFQKFKTKNFELTHRQAQGDGERSRTIKTILTGCVLKEDKKKFQKGFDLILDIKDLPKLPKLLKVKNYKLKIGNYLNIEPRCQTSFVGYVPIMTGCNNFCTYCVVPYTRGKETSRQVEEILAEVKNLIKGGLNPIRNEISNGAREIWLLGQNVNSYKSEVESRKLKVVNFAKLLKMVNEIPGNFWIRFTSPHPKDFSDELIETMAKSKKVTPYLNLPVQSGDDKILKRMNRPYTVSQYKNLVKKIRAAFKKYREDLEKEVAISTDIIVGFPGETKKQFQNTVKLFKEIKYDMAYIAKYSPRPGTAAAKLKDNVKPEEKERRYKVLTEILKETALGKNKKYIGRTLEVLVEADQRGSKRGLTLIGKTRTHKTVKIQSSKFKVQSSNLVGQFVKVKIIAALPWGLKGILI